MIKLKILDILMWAINARGVNKDKKMTIGSPVQQG